MVRFCFFPPNLNIGEKLKLKGKGIFFLRTIPKDKEVNLGTYSDSEVIFGEVSDQSLSALNVVVNNIYKPLVEKLEPPEWKMCQDD